MQCKARVANQLYSICINGPYHASFSLVDVAASPRQLRFLNRPCKSVAASNMAQESTATGTDQSGVAAESRRSGSSLSPAAVPTFDVPNRLADERSDLHTTYSSATLEERTSHPRPTYVYRHESSPLPPSANRTIAQDIYTYAVRQLLEHSSINDTGQHYPNTTTSSSGSASLHRPRTVPSRMISSDQQHRSRPSTLLSGAVPLRRPRDMLSAGARPSHQAQQSSHVRLFSG